LRGDRLPQFGQAGRRRVAEVVLVAQGLGRGIHDELRRGEVRLAGGVRDDGLALGLQGLRLRVDLESRRLGDRGQFAGQGCAFGHPFRVSRARSPECGYSGAVGPIFDTQYRVEWSSVPTREENPMAAESSY